MQIPFTINTKKQKASPWSSITEQWKWMTALLIPMCSSVVTPPSQRTGAPLRTERLDGCSAPPAPTFPGVQRPWGLQQPPGSSHVALSQTDFPQDLGDLLGHFDVKYGPLVSLLELKWVLLAQAGPQIYIPYTHVCRPLTLSQLQIHIRSTSYKVWWGTHKKYNHTAHMPQAIIVSPYTVIKWHQGIPFAMWGAEYIFTCILNASPASQVNTQTSSLFYKHRPWTIKKLNVFTGICSSLEKRRCGYKLLPPFQRAFRCFSADYLKVTYRSRDIQLLLLSF